MVKLKAFVKVKAPASTANLGPGFDVLGLALNLWNELEVRQQIAEKPSLAMQILGEGEGVLPQDKTNFIARIFLKTLQELGGRRALDKRKFVLKAVNRIPLARGLGSSAAATLCGILAAQALLGIKDLNDAIKRATQIEGHPDNIVPQTLGGFCLSSLAKGQVRYIKMAWPQAWQAVVCVPSFELSTRKARAVLPKQIKREDAVSNIAKTAFIVAAVQKKDAAALSFALNGDRLHEPYRAKLIPGFEAVKMAAVKAGALGAALSGAGPSILAVVPKVAQSQVGRAMERAFSQHKIKARSLNLSVVQSRSL